MNDVLVLCSDAPALAPLAGALDADVAVIGLSGIATAKWDDGVARLETEFARVAGNASYGAVVAAMWPTVVATRATLTDAAEHVWPAGELALAAWYGALQAAVRSVRDGGAVVALIERPGPIDAGGRAIETMVCDAIEALVRCVARAEGGRNVRVNCVSTVGRLVPEPLIAPAPPLSSYPGEMVTEVAGAIRMLVSSDASGCTGQVVNADCGRVM